MNKFYFFMLLSLLVQGCNSHKTTSTEAHPTILLNDSIQPQVDIKVNKKYDEQGNLTQFDSTYSYSYSSPGGMMHQLNPDSIYSQFKERFHSQYDDWFERSLNPIFFNDSLFKYDFFNKDYFDRRFELNRPRFNDLFREMDSIKTDMLNRHYPDGAMKRKW